MARSTHATADVPDRAFLVAAERAGALLPARESLDELAELARTAGAVVAGRTTQKLDQPNPGTYIGKGKVDEVRDESRAAGANVVVFDDELSPSQQRNLERALEVKVIDRTALILDIFATRARTREGRLQVSLAQMEYLLPRLAGQWSHLERMEGAIGTRGPGETQIETDRRLIRSRIAKIRREIEQIRTQRELYRRNRQRHNMPVVALVGYTNAGKSTLMQAVSGADVLSEDRLFATLDPITRRVRLPFGDTILLTDTVGFIQKLPTQLVAAFRATLEELENADLLLHVVDIGHPNAHEQFTAVESTLKALGVDSRPALIVLNKADLLCGSSGRAPADLDEAAAMLLPSASLPRDVILVSALKRWGIDELREEVGRALAGDLPPSAASRDLIRRAG